MKSLKILVIDDEEVICEGCRLILNERGHCVEHCMTGKTGMLAIEQNEYDVILLDLKLPDIDGINILKTIDVKNQMPCLIVMTGYATVSTALQSMKLGAVDYLAKPFTEDELIEAVETNCMQ
ncbi:MAG: response regulator [Desulfosalsimonas sp.]